MATFAFNFKIDEASNVVSEPTPVLDAPVASVAPCVTISASFSIASGACSPCTIASTFSGLRHVIPDADVVTGTSRDVVAREYEGGAKTWECTNDVIAYLLDADAGHSLRGLAVADLGCGTGLAGIAALTRLHAASCLFQDLNSSVLEHITTCNVALNAVDASSFTRAAFVAGDWRALPAWCAAQGRTASVDVVITSETVYRLDCLLPLLDAMRALLRPGGRAIVGAKRFYYGAELGGGSVAFADVVTRAGYIVRTVVSVADGASMIRDVLEVTGF